METYTELAIKMIREDIIENKESYLSITKNPDDFAEMFYQSTMKQGHWNESREDFGWVLYAARVIEDNEYLLILYAKSVFKNLLTEEENGK